MMKKLLASALTIAASTLAHADVGSVTSQLLTSVSVQSTNVASLTFAAGTAGVPLLCTNAPAIYVDLDPAKLVGKPQLAVALTALSAGKKVSVSWQSTTIAATGASPVCVATGISVSP